MWRRRPWRFYLGFPPIDLYSHGFRPFPTESGYLEMLEEYKADLEQELVDVGKEIEEIRERINQRGTQRPSSRERGKPPDGPRRPEV